MDQAVKDRWTVALRSGKYEQGAGMLRSAKDKYCCLGVLCDIEIDAEWKTDGQHPDLAYSILGANAYLPLKFGINIGISAAHEDDLTRMNDVHGDDRMDFKQIADWIEENL